VIDIVNNILFLTSIIVIFLILNQNDTSKELLKSQNASSAENPLETFTWIGLILIFICLLIKIKTNFN
jgi:preprotein translocase subunit SecG